MIKTDNLSHSFGENQLFTNLTFEIGDGIYALMGPSGSGKTTLLRLIAGLTTIQIGNIIVDKPISVSFQENRLFPWYSIQKNVALVSGNDQAITILNKLGLSDSLSKKPAELSGGMKRRVSLARALTAPSETVLLDEPFAGLDDETAEITLNVIREYSKNKTVLISTHNSALAEKLDGIIRIEKHR